MLFFLITKYYFIFSCIVTKHQKGMSQNVNYLISCSQYIFRLMAHLFLLKNLAARSRMEENVTVFARVCGYFMNGGTPVENHYIIRNFIQNKPRSRRNMFWVKWHHTKNWISPSLSDAAHVTYFLEKERFFVEKCNSGKCFKFNNLCISSNANAGWR